MKYLAKRSNGKSMGQRINVLQNANNKQRKVYRSI